MAELARKGMLSQQKPTAKPLNPEPPEPMPPPPPSPLPKNRALPVPRTQEYLRLECRQQRAGRIPFFKALRKNTEGNLGALINTTRFEVYQTTFISVLLAQVWFCSGTLVCGLPYLRGFVRQACPIAPTAKPQHSFKPVASVSKPESTRVLVIVVSIQGS